MTMQERINIELVGQPNAELDDILARLDRQQEILIEGEVDGSVIRSVDMLEHRLQGARVMSDRLDDSLDDIDGRGPRRAGRALSRMEDDARGADRQIDNIGDSLQRLGPIAAGVAGAAGVGGLFLAIDEFGSAATRVQTISDSLGIPVEFVQQIERLGNFIERDLDFGDYNEFGIRVGEIQNQIARGELEGGAFQRFQEALAPLGLDIRTIGTRDLPVLLDGIRTLPEELQAFALDEILGGQLAEAIRQIDALPPELRQRFEQSTVATEEQLIAARNLRAEMAFLRAEAGAVGIALLTDLVDPMTDVVELGQAFAIGFRDIREESPLLVAAIGAISAALVIYSTRAKIAAISQAALLALSGPAGIATLAAGAVALGAAGIAINRGLSIQQQRAEEEAQASIAADQISTATGEAVLQGSAMAFRAGSGTIADAVEGVRDDTLRAITPSVDCLDDRVNQIVDALADLTAEEEPTPVIPTPERPDVAFGEQGITIEEQQIQRVREVNTLIPEQARVSVSEEGVIRADIPSAVEQITQGPPVIRRDQEGPGVMDYITGFADEVRRSGIGEFFFGTAPEDDAPPFNFVQQESRPGTGFVDFLPQTQPVSVAVQNEPQSEQVISTIPREPRPEPVGVVSTDRSITENITNNDNRDSSTQREVRVTVTQYNTIEDASDPEAVIERMAENDARAFRAVSGE